MKKGLYLIFLSSMFVLIAFFKEFMKWYTLPFTNDQKNMYYSFFPFFILGFLRRMLLFGACGEEKRSL